MLLVSLHLKRRWYGTAKKQTTDSGKNDSPHAAKNTDNTIIMEEILQEFGHTISSNGNHTQWQRNLCIRILQRLALEPIGHWQTMVPYFLFLRCLQWGIEEPLKVVFMGPSNGHNLINYGVFQLRNLKEANYLSRRIILRQRSHTLSLLF